MTKFTTSLVAAAIVGSLGLISGVASAAIPGPSPALAKSDAGVTQVRMMHHGRMMHHHRMRHHMMRGHTLRKKKGL